MLDISTELKELYKSNNVPKYYDIYIPLLDLHINSHGTNDKIVHGSFGLKESLCSDKDLRFGSCEASEIKFVVADISHDLKGQEITIDQYISEHVVPFGKYKIDSCKKQDDLRYKEIIAYDKLADIDIDVSEWYNSLFPTGVETYTLKKFRSLLLAHLGIEEIDQTLPNDDMVVEKTIDPTQISGRDVLKATVELNGAFGHINRQGKFIRIVLQPSYGLYPSETLYPSEDLYPVAETDTSYVQEDIVADSVSKAMYEKVHFEEYTVKEIDKLIIRAEEDDIGAIVGGDQKRVIDTQTGTSIQSTKSDDSVVEIQKIEGASRQVVTVQGKNLIDYTKIVARMNTTLNILADGEILAIGKMGWTGFNFPLPITLKGKTVSARYTILEDTTIFKNIRLCGKKEDNSSYYLTISNGGKVTIPTTATTVMFEFMMNNTAIALETDVILRVKDIQLEEGPTATPYEPFTPNSPSPDYPSPIVNANNFNIVAKNVDGSMSNKVNIPYELASLPNGVKDTIEYIGNGKGRLIQRVGKEMLDGSPDESWVLSESPGNYLRFTFSAPKIKKGTTNLVADKFKTRLTSEDPLYTAYENIHNNPTNSRFGIVILANRLSTPDVAGFKTFLQANPVTVQYELATPIETIIDLPSLTSYKGITNITTTANPQVSLTADFYVNPINTYVIEGNFLVFGKSAVELEQIALNAFGNMAKRPYRPYEAQSIGLPYIEVGDALQFATDDVVVGYVLQRTLTGIQALRDTYTAKGNEEREQNFGLNTEIIQLQGRYNKIKKDVDGVSIEVGNLETRTNTKFEQTDEKISLEAQRAIGAEGTLSGQINVLAGQVILKVDANGNIAVVELDADASEGSAIKIKADNIGLEGLITANGNFKILADGSMEATNGKFSGDITGSSITGTTFMQTGSKGTVKIEDGGVIADYVLAQSFASDSISLSGNMSCDNMQCNTINSYKPIHSGNIGQQSVEYAASADISNYAQNANDANHAGNSQYAYGLVSYGAPIGSVYVSSNGNFRPYGDSSRSCGTSEGRWSSVWALNGAILTSDERQKEEITLLEDDERFIKFAKMIVPYTFKMKAGTSGRRHVGFIAQRIEEAMIECNISSMEFAGLIKAPVYARNILTEDGKDTGEYDTTSEIIDYTYHLRYDEFIPLIFLWLRNLS